MATQLGLKASLNRSTSGDRTRRSKRAFGIPSSEKSAGSTVWTQRGIGWRELRHRSVRHERVWYGVVGFLTTLENS